VIFALVGWAAESWNVATARAVTAGLVPHCAPRLGQLDTLIFLAFLEAVVCESEDGAKTIQRLYDEGRPAPPVTRGARRRAEIEHMLGLVDDGSA
jgi:hypothetical protein